MQTAAIPYRVADFLKEHPPFQGMEEADLLMLAQRGRVRFHESDEFLCWQGSAYAPFLLVIQQGTVALWADADGTEKLHDIRGPGDIIGIERYAAADGETPKWLYSAKATSEVVIYAFNAADFATLLTKYSHAVKYAQAHASVRTDYNPPGQKRGLHEMYLAELTSASDSLSCAPTDTIAEAAARMLAAGGHSIAVTGSDGLRMLTTNDLLRSAAAGTLDVSQPVSSLGLTSPDFVRPDVEVGPAVVALVTSQSPAIAITSDGTPEGALQKWFDASGLVTAFGDHPVSILDSIRGAGAIASLRNLVQRAYAFALDHFGSPLAVDWVAEFLCQVDAAVLRRILCLTGASTADAAWCFAGTAARREHVAPSAHFIVRIGDDGSSAPVNAVRAALAECGYFHAPRVESATLPEWQDRYRQWIGNPLGGGLSEALPYLDLSAFAGPAQPVEDLTRLVRSAIHDSPVFVQLLANDCLDSLPPLTFFRDQVVDESGQHQDVFRLEQTVLRPLSDVARVFGIASGRALAGSTLERFEFARSFLPAQTLLFKQAADSLRVALHLQANIGIRLGNDGADIPPEWLSRQDRQTLKTGFRTILRLLEFTAGLQWLEVP